MLRLRTIASFIMIIAPLPASAYTQADVDACTPDAFRLCQNAIPDAARVQQCLTERKRLLSPACKIVFDRPASAQETPDWDLPAAARPAYRHTE
jgi:hypothetical protein